MHSVGTTQNRPMAGRRAFTLIELLVVMIVIALIIAITLPALGGVRDSARRAGTQSMMNDITQAVSQFQNDHRRMPGYFSARDLGAAANATAGMSAMENLMLELMGVGVQPTNPGGTGWIEVGPGGTATGWVNVDLIGSASDGAKNYYAPDAKHYVPQTIGTQQMASGSLANAAAEGAPQLSDVVDDFGSPLLAWVSDDTAVGQITQEAQFAQEQSPTGNAAPARFYWQSNACFLNSTSLGKRGRDQMDTERGSWISEANSAANRARSLIGILGNPSSPYRPTNATATFVPSIPTAARGQFILHSAGIDGVYYGRRDKASAGVKNPPGYIDYRANFVPDTAAPLGPGNQHTTRDGKQDVIDFAKEFDDLVAQTGN